MMSVNSRCRDVKGNSRYFKSVFENGVDSDEGQGEDAGNLWCEGGFNCVSHRDE